MKKILLINPSPQETYGDFKAPFYPPLGLGYLAAVLENAGHSVKIIDIDADKISETQFIDIIKQGYALIGISTTSPTFNSAEQLCKIIKLHTNAITILGGIHPTIAPDHCLLSSHVDVLVRGEGEATILDLVSAIEAQKSFDGVDGISYKKNGGIIHNKSRALISNLDTVPFPARHLFSQRKYSYPDALASPVFPIITSRGCPHLCTYCCSKQIFSTKVRFRSAGNVVDEIEQLIHKYQAKEIHIWDDNFTLNKKRVFEIHDELKKRAIKILFQFSSGLRVDQVNEEILRCLKSMGAYNLAFGVESGNQNILNGIKKGTSLAQIETSFKLAKKIGFETWGFFMIGLPGETSETILDTIRFAKKLDPDVAKFHILKPFPGTEAFFQLKEQGLITETDFSKYGIHTRPVHRLSSLSEDDLLHWSKTAYRGFYLRPSKLFQHALRIKSIERFKLNVSTGFCLLKSMLK